MNMEITLVIVRLQEDILEETAREVCRCSFLTTALADDQRVILAFALILV